MLYMSFHIQVFQLEKLSCSSLNYLLIDYILMEVQIILGFSDIQFGCKN